MRSRHRMQSDPDNAQPTETVMPDFCSGAFVPRFAYKRNFA